MPKAYWITCYHDIKDPDRLRAYAQLAGPALEGGGGRFLARATAAQAFEAGRAERTVVIEFDSVPVTGTKPTRCHPELASRSGGFAASAEPSPEEHEGHADARRRASAAGRARRYIAAIVTRAAF